jgi:hypothetical protein
MSLARRSPGVLTRWPAGIVSSFPLELVGSLFMNQVTASAQRARF